MKLLRSFIVVAGVALALGATADTASAGGIGVPCIGCGHGGGGGAAPERTTLFGPRERGGHALFGNRPNLPVYQAAPWYQYWPYDGHFMTPAPVTGAFYGPPMTGNFPVNPYFPGAQGAAGFGYGGPPPGGFTPPPQPMPPR